MSLFEQAYQSAMQLPDADRARLVEDLIATLTPEDAAPLDNAWLAETERRSAEIDAGEVQPIAWETVRQRTRDRYKQHC